MLSSPPDHEHTPRAGAPPQRSHQPRAHRISIPGQELGRRDLVATSAGPRRRMPARVLLRHAPSGPRRVQGAGELGDVDVDPRDFQTRWYDPRGGMAAVRALLAHQSRRARALLTEPVRAELEQIRRVLEVAQRLAYTFYIAEVEASASRRFAGAEWSVGQEKNERHPTRSDFTPRPGSRRPSGAGGPKRRPRPPPPPPWASRRSRRSPGSRPGSGPRRRGWRAGRARRPSPSP